MKYRIGICDDEILHVKINTLFAQEIGKRNHFEVDVKGFTEASQLQKYLAKESLDVLFLDIDLGGDSGILLAAKIMEKYPELVIIFITGHREFTEEAFDVEAMGYIVKPVEEQKMERVLKNALLQVMALKGQNCQQELIITEENIKKKIIEEDIIHIERKLSKSVICTREKDYKVYETMTSLCERLSNNFLRVNKNEVVNRKEIEEIRHNMVVLKNGKMITIGRTYRKAVMESCFNNYKIM